MPTRPVRNRNVHETPAFHPAITCPIICISGGLMKSSAELFASNGAVIFSACGAGVVVLRRAKVIDHIVRVARLAARRNLIGEPVVGLGCRRKLPLPLQRCAAREQPHAGMASARAGGWAWFGILHLRPPPTSVRARFGWAARRRCTDHNVMNLARNWYFVQVGPLDPRAKTLPSPRS